VLDWPNGILDWQNHDTVAEPPYMELTDQEEAEINEQNDIDVHHQQIQVKFAMYL
jgi:hypothetical protein